MIADRYTLLFHQTTNSNADHMTDHMLTHIELIILYGTWISG